MKDLIRALSPLRAVLANKTVSRKAFDDAFDIACRLHFALMHAEKILDPQFQKKALEYINNNIKTLKNIRDAWSALVPGGRIENIQDTKKIDQFLEKNYANFVNYLKQSKQFVEYFISNANPKETNWEMALKHIEKALQILGE